MIPAAPVLTVPPVTFRTAAPAQPNQPAAASGGAAGLSSFSTVLGQAEADASSSPSHGQARASSLISSGQDDQSSSVEIADGSTQDALSVVSTQQLNNSIAETLLVVPPASSVSADQLGRSGTEQSHHENPLLPTLQVAVKAAPVAPIISPSGAVQEESIAVAGILSRIPQLPLNSQSGTPEGSGLLPTSAPSAEDVLQIGKTASASRLGEFPQTEALLLGSNESGRTLSEGRIGLPEQGESRRGEVLSLRMPIGTPVADLGPRVNAEDLAQRLLAAPSFVQSEHAIQAGNPLRQALVREVEIGANGEVSSLMADGTAHEFLSVAERAFQDGSDFSFDARQSGQQHGGQPASVNGQEPRTSFLQAVEGALRPHAVETRPPVFAGQPPQRLQLDVTLPDTTRLQIEVAVQQRQVSANMLLDQAALRNLVMQHQPQLDAQLAANGLELKELWAEVRDDQAFARESFERQPHDGNLELRNSGERESEFDPVALPEWFGNHHVHVVA